MGWLEDFVEHTKYGEAPPKVMFWVAVSTVAGALRRKVWIDEFTFQWTPNFYVLLIGPPGVLKKSTSINLGMRMLARVDGVEFGAQATTWEQLITHMAGSTQTYKVEGKDFEASCLTIDLSEFGTLFDPQNRAMVDALTDIFDAKLHTFKKETKTNGCDEIINPWLNICACTTPGWLDDNFSGKFVRSGFAGRVIYVYCDKPGRIAHPSRHMPGGMRRAEDELVEGLRKIAELSGPARLTEEAYKWSEAWYEKYRDWLENECPKADMGLYSRKQAHMMKLATVISASNGNFPVIGVQELKEACTVLESVEADVSTVFGTVGQSPVSKLARNLVDVLVKEGEQKKKVLYRKHFFRLVGIKEFNDAVESAKQSGMVKEGGVIGESTLKVV